MTGQTFWLTGLPCSGKTTIAIELSKHFPDFVLLDGDVIRKGLCSDLGFCEQDRAENIRRISHLCELFNANGKNVIASFVSPTTEIRSQIKSIVSNLRLVHVNCSPEECERRDVKGMWKLAREGKIKNWTGIDAVYQPPTEYDCKVDTEHETLEESVLKVFKIISQ